MNKPYKAILRSFFCISLYLLCVNTVRAEEITELPAEEEIPEIMPETTEEITPEPEVTQEEEMTPETEEENSEEIPAEVNEEETEPSEEEEPLPEEPAEEETPSGFTQIDGVWFYYDSFSGEVLKGEQFIDGNWYLFDDNDGHMLTGFQTKPGQNITVYYSPETGAMQYGRVEDGGRGYYLNMDTGELCSGLISEGGKTYFIDEDTGEKTGGQVYENGKWYCFDEETKELVTGFHYTEEEKKTVYYGGSGDMKTGEQTIASDNYYFDEETGAMATGLTEIPSLNRTVYYDEKGRMQYGEQVIDGAKYYFNETSGAMTTGFKYLTGKKITVYYSQYGRMQYGEQKIGGYWYWLDESTGARYSGFKYFSEADLLRYYDANGRMKTTTFTVDGKTYNVRSNGDIINRYVYTTPYYAQGDGRWAGLTFGYWNMRGAGCVPTSIAMALSAVTGSAVTPDTVASWLYNNTMEYNKTEIGGSGLCAPKAASAWGVSTSAIGSLANLKAQLTLGKVVTAAMNPGIFSPAGYTHMIVLTKISGNQVYVQDPLNSGRNGWYSIDTIWNQRSTDPTDNRGGYVFYAFYKRWY